MAGETGWVETIKTVGSFVGLLTGVFVVTDRLLRERPMVDLRPVGDNDHNLEIEITNTSKESIVIHRIACQPDALRASRSTSLEEPLREAWGHQWQSLIDPLKAKTFYLITRSEWDRLPDTKRVSIVVRWSHTSPRWLPPIPIWRTSTVGKINLMRKTSRLL
jgi:hypothetical protein